MKTFIVLFAAIAFAAADWQIQTQDNLISYRTVCVKELNVPEDHIELFKKWNFPDDETTRCYIKCIFPKLGLWDETNGWNVENLVQQLGQNREDKDVVRVAVNKCIDDNKTQKSDACSWVYRGFKCFIEGNLSLVQTSIKQ